MKNQRVLCLLVLFLSFIFLGYGFTTAQPTWITSNFMRAGHENVISTLTG